MGVPLIRLTILKSTKKSTNYVVTSQTNLPQKQGSPGWYQYYFYPVL